jgi:hypothetical protein
VTNSPRKSRGEFTRQLYKQCPRKAEYHTPAPENYTEWVEWTQRMLDEGFVQRRCPECNKFAIWEKNVTQEAERGDPTSPR